MKETERKRDRRNYNNGMSFHLPSMLTSISFNLDWVLMSILACKSPRDPMCWASCCLYPVSRSCLKMWILKPKNYAGLWEKARDRGVSPINNESTKHAKLFSDRQNTQGLFPTIKESTKHARRVFIQQRVNKIRKACFIPTKSQNTQGEFPTNKESTKQARRVFI